MTKFWPLLFLTSSYLYLESHVVIGCSSRVDVDIHVDKAVKYTLPRSPLITREIRDNVWQSHATYAPPKKSQCTNLRKGMSHLHFGINKYFVNSGTSDFDLQMSKLFDFECPEPNNFDDRNYQLPTQVETVLTGTTKYLRQEITAFWANKYPMEEGSRDVLMESIQQEGIHSVTSLTELYEDEKEERNGWYNYFFQKSALGKVHEENTTITLIKYVMVVYSAKMLPNITAGQASSDAYHALPDEYETNRVAYYHFIKNFGTHFYVNAQMGGRVSIVLHHTNTTDITSLEIKSPIPTLTEAVNDIDKKLSTKILKKHIFAEGGLLSFNGSIEKWSEKVEDHPRPVSGMLLEIPRLFDQEGRSRKFQSFLKAFEDENSHQQLKSLLLELESAKENKLIKDVIQLVNNQLKFINPDKQLKSVVQYNTKENANLNKFYLECELPVVATDTENQHIFEKHIIIPGLCMNIRGFSNCRVVSWKLPLGYECLKAYELHQCDGESVEVDTINKLTKSMQTAQSLQLCHDNF